MEIQELIKKFKQIIAEWNEKEVKGEGFNLINFINRIWGIGETKHSQILGFFLNPRENHGQGGLFLKLFLEKLGFETINFNPEVWIVEVEQRSNGRDQIDILIQSHRLGVSIVIENKSNGAEDQPHQLYRYWESAIYYFHNKDEQKVLNPKNSRIVYLPQWGLPSEQTRTRIEGYKEPYPEKLTFEEQGGIISCWTYYTHIVEWLNKCIGAMGGENHIVKQLVRNYIEYWSTSNSKNKYYMTELNKLLEQKEDWQTINELANTVNNLKVQWANDFNNLLASIECHPDFVYNNDFHWTYEGNWGDLAFIYEPHKGFSIWKAGAGKAREWYKDRLEKLFPDFVISQDNNTNYLMHLKDQNEILLCKSEDNDEVFLWEYHKKGNNVHNFLAKRLKNYTNNQEVQTLFRWFLKESNWDKDLIFLYYPYYEKGFCLWKKDFSSKKEQYKSIFLEFFSEDFEWLDDNTDYIMRLKGNAFSAPGDKFVETGFSKYEVVEKLTEILQKYTNEPKIVELFQTINTDFQE